MPIWVLYTWQYLQLEDLVDHHEMLEAWWVRMHSIHLEVLVAVPHIM